jgi:hypothetical protein
MPGMQSQPLELEIRRLFPEMPERTGIIQNPANQLISVDTSFDFGHVTGVFACFQYVLYLLFSVLLLEPLMFACNSHPRLLARFFLCHQKIAAGSMARFLHLLSR